MEHLENPKGEIVDVATLIHEDNIKETISVHHQDPKSGRTNRYAEEYIDQFSPLEEESSKNVGAFDVKNESDFTTQAKNDSALLDSIIGISRNHPPHEMIDQEDSVFSRSGPLLIGQGKQENADDNLASAHNVPSGIVINEKLGGPKQKSEALMDQTSPREPAITKPVAQIRLPAALAKENEKNLFEGASHSGGLSKQQIHDLLYWADVRKSAIFFAAGFFILLCLTLFPFLSVLAYVGLIVVSIGITIRLVALITAYFKKDVSDIGVSKIRVVAFEETYIEPYLNQLYVGLSENGVQSKVSELVAKWNNFVQELRKIFLAKDIILSLEVAVGLWLLTYISGAISLAGLLLIAYVGGFTLPKFYKVYEKPLNHYYELAATKLSGILKVIEDKYGKIRAKKPTDKQN